MDGFIVYPDKILLFSRKFNEKTVKHLIYLLEETYKNLSKKFDIMVFKGEESDLTLWTRKGYIYGYMGKIDEENIIQEIKEKEEKLEKLAERRKIPPYLVKFINSYVKEKVPPFVFKKIEKLLPQTEIELTEFEEKLKDIKKVVKELLGKTFSDMLENEIMGILVEHGIHEPLK